MGVKDLTRLIDVVLLRVFMYLTSLECMLSSDDGDEDTLPFECMPLTTMLTLRSEFFDICLCPEFHSSILVRQRRR